MSRPASCTNVADQSSDAEKESISSYSMGGGAQEKARKERGRPEGLDSAESEAGAPADDFELAGQDAEPDGRPSGVLSNVVSRVLSRASIKTPEPPPDGGVKAWTAVACAHLVIMNTWGFINSFGAFQTYYTSAFGRSPSDISWIGSIQVFLLFFVGTWAGRATDAGYFRQVFLLGSAFQVLGIFAAASSTRYWQLFLSQGLCMGLGNGCIFSPTMTVVSTYFARRRNFAIGIVAAGSGTGGLIFPSMARQLLPVAGFPWTMRSIGFVQLAGLVVANTFLRPRIPPRRTGALVEWAAFKDLEYTFYAVGSFFCFLGLYFGFFYIAAFSREISGMSYSDSLNLLLVLNGVGIPARVCLNLLADRVGPINLFVPTALAAGLCVLCWTAMPAGDTAGLYAWTVFYGIAGGGIQSLFPAGLTSLTSDLRKAGVRMGMVFTINSVSVLTGPPIAGALITAARGKFYGAQAFAGAVILVGMGFMVASRTVLAKKLGAGWRAKV